VKTDNTRVQDWFGYTSLDYELVGDQPHTFLVTLSSLPIAQLSGVVGGIELGKKLDSAKMRPLLSWCLITST
jgi:hypothetical protein